MRASVVFPAPDSPRIPTTSLSRTANVTSWSIVREADALESAETLSPSTRNAARWACFAIVSRCAPWLSDCIIRSPTGLGHQRIDTEALAVRLPYVAVTLRLPNPSAVKTPVELIVANRPFEHDQ